MERLGEAKAGFPQLDRGHRHHDLSGPHDDAHGRRVRRFERAMLKERTKAGLETARAEGRVRGTSSEVVGSTEGRDQEDSFSGREDGG